MLKKCCLSILLLCCLLALSNGVLADEMPLLVGVWGFAGGAEAHGDGFRLNADGTGVWLEGVNYDAFPLHTFTETDSTFTWKTVQEGEKLYLVETYADGRMVQWEVQIQGDGRIHFPEGDGGGFYWPVPDEKLQAYIAGKRTTGNLTAFDELLADYLTDALYAGIENNILDVQEAAVIEQDKGWKLLVTGYHIDDDVFFRFSVDEEYTRVLAGTGINLFAGDEESQPWFAAQSLSAYYISFSSILDSYLTWEYIDEEAAQAEETSAREIIALSGKKGSFSKNKMYDVYQGPGAVYGRSGGGKGKVSTNGDIFCYGTWNGWLLIEYEISDSKHRIGWIQLSDLPASQQEAYEKLDFAQDGWQYVCGVVTEDVQLTDDPFYSGNQVGALRGGTSVHCLGMLDGWMLVEGFNVTLPQIGFVPADSVEWQNGYAENAVFTIDEAKTYTRGEIYAAMEVVCDYVVDHFAGMAVLEVKYIEAESADADDWWQPEEAGCEGMQLFADLSSMELYDFEIAAFGKARDYGFILYRREGGSWYVGNNGYE